MDIEQPPSLIGLATQSQSAAKYNPVYEDPYEDEYKEKKEKKKDRETGSLLRVAIISTLLFVFLSQPILYKLSHKASQYMMTSPIDIVTNEGFATPKGILIHGVLFFIFMLFIIF
jgi:hypothetical protein